MARLRFKIKRYDIFWMVLMCAVMWAIHQCQAPKNQPSNPKSAQQEKDLQQTQELQKACMYGDQEACKKVYGK